MKNMILVALIIVAFWYGYSKYQHIAVAAAEQTNAQASSQNSFKCDERIYCSQMTSCSEATYFLQNCPGTKMDGDNDGIPCEQQWCR